MVTMPGRSFLRVTDEQKAVLAELARSEMRGEADRARAVLLTLSTFAASAQS
jgi:hypothetical protein